MTMEAALRKLRKRASEPKSVLFDLSVPAERARFKVLLEDGSIRAIADDFEEEQRELYGIRHPDRVHAPGFAESFATHYAKLTNERPPYEQGCWAYFPWSGTASHILPEREYHAVRTARNRNLVTEEEQRRFYDAHIGIGGLSVGSSVAFALALSGGAKHMKLADMDRLALSNTNRVLAGADRLGMLKVEMAAQTLYELNPYAEIELYPEGLSPKNIGAFCEGLDVIVDELDNLAVKYLIREEARKRKLPVVMAADNGDNAVVDIERYDLDPDLAFFHNRLGETSYEKLKSLDKFDIGRHITKHVGPENVTERMQQSLLEMGKSIVSWPQLGIAAMVNGAAVAYCVRKIVNGQPLENDRALISLDEKLVPNHSAKEERAKRAEAARAFRKMFKL